MASVQTILTPQKIFGLHPRIRWTAFTRNGTVVFCQMRPRVKSYTSDETDRSFMELGPLILTGVSERMTPGASAGIIESIIINFEKDSLLLVRVKDGNLAISVDRPDAHVVFQEIESRIKKVFD
jgi:hypothetical protein